MLSKKTIYDKLESKIPNVTSLSTTAALNTKNTSIENKIPDITGFVRPKKFSSVTSYIPKNNESVGQ